MTGKLGIDRLVIFLDNGEYLTMLDDETIGRIVRRLLCYVATAERPEQDGWDKAELMAYRMLEASVDSDAIAGKKVDRRQFSSRTNGMLGGRPKKNTIEEKVPDDDQNQQSPQQSPTRTPTRTPTWTPPKNPALNYEQRKYTNDDFKNFFEDLSGTPASNEQATAQPSN